MNRALFCCRSHIYCRFCRCSPCWWDYTTKGWGAWITIVLSWEILNVPRANKRADFEAREGTVDGSYFPLANNMPSGKIEFDCLFGGEFLSCLVFKIS